MKKRNIIFALSGLLLFLISIVSTAQNPTYYCAITNDALVSSSVYEFDLVLSRTGSTSFELANFQAGIIISSSFVNGGSITASVVSGSSELNTEQIPTAITYTAASNCIKLAPRRPPRTLDPLTHTSTTNGTVISTTGTRICRIRLTNSGTFGTASMDPVWNFSTAPYNTIVTAYTGPSSSRINTPITNAASHSRTFDLSLFIESLYDAGTGKMNKVMDADSDGNSWNLFDGTVVDTLSVEIASATYPHATVAAIHGVPIDQSGHCRVPIPSTLSGDHFVIIRHRSSVETWSASGVVSFTPSVPTLNLINDPANAYGSNLRSFSGGIYAIYSGDITGETGVKDGYVDGYDVAEIFNLAQDYAYGYRAADLTGDGFVDGFDVALVFNNAQEYVGKVTPLD